ncbi:uncharacterized protein si:zfos-464b6.2 [Toxotes jaculatrix]|uniref:uncharacterized protein si:zfos-464b6.2 n=1 Tax=Toxotes jaculatrix TaxID=941984 RepID=UPI001B3A9231|nr:uncharacterized protein si:zfos-464b6.2 [Toxotes jaculatrix]XP_040902001.1 uncharacterized protein si:zfos-464b6.2 [Toxotes jaculatrix]XP_040902002.1 uncharacterized protein si:zfos-464b6.2 [Toxotes jaculatrix]
MKGHIQQQVKMPRRLNPPGRVTITITVFLLIGPYGIYRIHQSLLQIRLSTEPQIKVQPTVPPQCAAGKLVSQGEKMSLVSVNTTKTLLVSAYQEHRRGNKEVRVIAVVQRSEAVDYHCLLCCQDQLHISNGVCSIHTNHFDFAYGTADIMCPLPSACETVSHITVISAAAKPEDKLDKEFIEVKNQKPESDSFPHNFTICLSTMFDFTNALQLVQGLEMLQLLGVDRVVIYKTSCSPEVQLILDYYTHKGLVEVISWPVSRFLKVSRGWLPEVDPGDIHYFGQIPALNDCVYRYMYLSKYVALHDIDELILPQSVDSWLELLPLLETKYGADLCYMFENNVFPNTMQPHSKTLPSLWPNVSGVDILAHLYQEPVIKEIFNHNFKIIVNPRVVYTPTVHGLLASEKGCAWVDRNMARMYHTRAPKQPKLSPDQLIYDDRLMSYSARLIPAVSTVLSKSGLLPKDSKQ